MGNIHAVDKQKGAAKEPTLRYLNKPQAEVNTLGEVNLFVGFSAAIEALHLASIAHSCPAWLWFPL